jgi:hypothetical protein
MPKFMVWISTSLLAAACVVPVLAGTNDATDSKTPAATTAAAQPAAAANPNLVPAGNANVTALLGVLVMKGVLAPSEAEAIRNAAPEAEFQLLVETLARKGVLSASDLAATPAPAATAAMPAAPAPAAMPAASLPSAPAPAATGENATMATPRIVAPTMVTPAMAAPMATPVAPPEPKPDPLTVEVAAQAGPTAPPKETPGPSVVPAVAPLRVLPIDPPVKEGLIPAFKIGGTRVTPYGFLKATGVRDSSQPNGDDFPFPGIFLNSSSPFNTGPTTDPSFHLKARSSRLGVNFEWPDIAGKLTLTGRAEMDFEGGFTEVDNADVSSIRNPQPRLRLAYVRADYAATEATDLFFEGGQNWSIFGSSALPNMLETTFLGAFWGNIWERTPQFRFGLVQKLGGSRNFKLSPEFALMMPSSGQIYKLNGTLGGFEAQIGEGEREGADSGRPEYEARMVLQFQLDKAPAVAPAQIQWSGFEGRRTSITTSSDFTGLQAAALAGTSFQNGFNDSSNMFGNQLAIQLPTRWFTIVASAFRGGDMRFMFAGQLNTNFTDTSGLFQLQQFATVDGVAGTVSGGSMLGCTVNAAIGSACTAAGGQTEIAREHAVGAFGGFINLGLPLSRWFKADPKGHNAGWQILLTAGKDQVVHHDLAHANGLGCTSADGLTPCGGGIPLSMGTEGIATLYYKLNPSITFSFEQSRYASHILPEDGALYTIAGKPSRVWQDQRSEFGPIFTF